MQFASVELSDDEMESVTAQAYALGLSVPEFLRELLRPYLPGYIREEGAEFGNGGGKQEAKEGNGE